MQNSAVADSPAYVQIGFATSTVQIRIYMASCLNNRQRMKPYAVLRSEQGYLLRHDEHYFGWRALTSAACLYPGGC